MTVKKRIDGLITQIENFDGYVIRQICLCPDDYEELTEAGGIVGMKDSVFYHGIRLHAVVGTRSYILIEL